MSRNNRSVRRAAALAAIAVLAAIGALVQGAAPGLSAQLQGPLVTSSSTSLGPILVDSRGHTLYLFEKDKSGKSACSGKCAGAWPPLVTQGKPLAGAGLEASLLGTTRRADGRLQVTYHGHPLYTFFMDTKKGQVHGENVDAFGGEWYAVSRAGTEVEPHAAPTTTTTTSSSGGYGY